MMGMDGGASMIAKTSLAMTLAGFGVFTTGLLHWFTMPYVHRMKSYKGEDGRWKLDVTTMNFFATPVEKTLDLEKQVEPGAEGSMHPLSTFRADGKAYYVDREYFGNAELLDRLDPPLEDLVKMDDEDDGDDEWEHGDGDTKRQIL